MVKKKALCNRCKGLVNYSVVPYLFLKIEHTTSPCNLIEGTHTHAIETHVRIITKR
jgi:hypothetical protein